MTAIRGARNYLGDKIMRTAKPHRLLDPSKGPLIAVRLNILTRKTLGGLQPTSKAACWKENGAIVPGLYAAGEVAGFGGGAITGIMRWRGRFSAGASSPAAWRDGAWGSRVQPSHSADPPQSDMPIMRGFRDMPFVGCHKDCSQLNRHCVVNRVLQRGITGFR